jgi:4'-phosphopantetheinyl transferase
VHVWRASLDAWGGHAPELLRLLSRDERERAERHRSAVDASRSAVSRALLRRLLGRYLRSDPAGLLLRRGASGKPELEGAPIRFNLSHAGGLALYAFSAERPVGVDVEPVRRGFEDLARRFFSAAEADAVSAADDARRTAVFFRYWTLKEAFVKGTGRGLGLPLEEFQVVTAPGSDDARVSSAVHGALAAPWRLRSFIPCLGFAGAVAVGGPYAGVQFYGADERVGP